MQGTEARGAMLRSLYGSQQDQWKILKKQLQTNVSEEMNEGEPVVVDEVERKLGPAFAAAP